MSDNHRHILGNFERALNELTTDLNRMAGLCREQLRTAMRGLLERDTDLCNRGHRRRRGDRPPGDEDRRGRAEDHHALPAGGLRPAQGRLRHEGLEQPRAHRRPGRRHRQARPQDEQEPRDSGDPPRRTDLREGGRPAAPRIEAFDEGDVEIASTSRRDDKELDKAYKEPRQATDRADGGGSEHIKDYLDLQFIIRFLERIGDHAKNISEDAVFAEAAVDIRHGGDLPEDS